MASDEEDGAVSTPSYRYFIAFISMECSGRQHRNDIVTCNEKLYKKEDFERLEDFLASKHLASRTVIQSFQLL